MSAIEAVFTINRTQWKALRANGPHGNPYAQSNAKKQLRYAAKIWAQNYRNKGGRQVQPPAHCVAYVQYPTKAKADPSNAQIVAKPLVDGLVEGRLLVEDHSEVFTGPDMRRDTKASVPGFWGIRLVITEIQGKGN